MRDNIILNGDMRNRYPVNRTLISRLSPFLREKESLIQYDLKAFLSSSQLKTVAVNSRP
ncbi:MAG: hypothetical protein IKZ39_00350 [Lachnospiraceae bacterium]|nr:hypothetical protein [Lachnospiraceae bacterium]